MSILYKIFNDSGLTALTNYIKTTRAKAVSNEAAIGGLGEDLAGLSGEVVTALDNKQNKLTFDTTPTAGSTNPVTSGGVKNYVDSSILDHTHEASKISAGTFAGQVVANASGQTPGTMLLRNSKLVSAEETPTVNGEICWVYS